MPTLTDGKVWQVDGRLTLEDAAGIETDLAVAVRRARPVAHEATDLDILAEGVDGGQPLMGRKRDQLHTTGVEQWIGADNKCIGALLHQADKGCIDLTGGAGGENLDLPPDGRCRRLSISCQRLGIAIVRVDQRGKSRRAW